MRPLLQRLARSGSAQCMAATGRGDRHHRSRSAGGARPAASVLRGADAMSRTVLDFFVPGDPAPQGPKRYLGDGRIVESSKQDAEWRADVRHVADAVLQPRHEALWAAPVYVQLDFYLSRPKSHYGTGRNAQKIKESAPKWPGRPDVDKLARAVLDALTGLVIADDSTVVELQASKSYGRRPGVAV